MNQVGSKWEINEKEMINAVFRLFYEQPYYAIQNGNPLYQVTPVDDMGNLREMLQEGKAVILYMHGKRLLKDVGHAVVIKNIYSIISLDSKKQQESPMFCFYIYDNNYPDTLMPFLVQYKKIRNENGEFGYYPQFHVFGEYANTNFFEIGYAQKRY